MNKNEEIEKIIKEALEMDSLEAIAYLRFKNEQIPNFAKLSWKSKLVTKLADKIYGDFFKQRKSLYLTKEDLEKIDKIRKEKGWK